MNGLYGKCGGSKSSDKPLRQAYDPSETLHCLEGKVDGLRVSKGRRLIVKCVLII